MEEKARKILQKLIDSPESAEKLFGSFEGALSYINRISPEVYNEIDTKDETWYDNDLQDRIIYHQLNNSENKIDYIKKFIDRHSFNDLDVKGDRIIYNADLDDVLNLYDDRGRDSTAKGVAKLALGDDDGYTEWFSGSIYDLSDSIDILNPKNLQELKLKSIEVLNGIISRENIKEEGIELLDEMLEIQGNPEYLEVNMENISEMLEDSETLKFLFDNYLADLEFDLSNAYNQAYNDAFGDEILNDVYSGMQGLLGKMERNDYTITSKDGKKSYRTNYLIDVTPNIVNIFLSYFSDYKNHYHQIDYYGNFTNMMDEYLDDNGGRIDFRIPDFPDSRKVEQIFNDIVEI
jgi:hypothetical protein